MESINKDMAARVWKRVQGERSAPAAQPLPAPALQQTPEGLLLEVLTDAAIVRQLAQQTKDPTATMLKQLAKQKHTQAAALRGICHLAGIPSPTLLPEVSRQDNPDASLRRLLGRLLRRAQELRRLCDHPEFGILYEALARQTQDSGLLLAQIIGNAKNK